MSDKVLPVLFFIIIIISDLPLTLLLNKCNTALLSLVIAFVFVVFIPWVPKVICYAKQEARLFLAIQK